MEKGSNATSTPGKTLIALFELDITSIFQMNEVNQLQGINPNPGLNQINQMGAYSRQNQFPGTQAAGLGDMG